MRVSFDVAPEPQPTIAQALAASARRLFYFLKLWGAVLVVYLVACATFG